MSGEIGQFWGNQTTDQLTSPRSCVLQFTWNKNRLQRTQVATCFFFAAVPPSGVFEIHRPHPIYGSLEWIECRDSFRSSPFLPISAHFCPFLPISAHCCPFLPIFCPFLPISGHFCPLLPISAILFAHQEQDAVTEATRRVKIASKTTIQTIPVFIKGRVLKYWKSVESIDQLTIFDSYEVSFSPLQRIRQFCNSNTALSKQQYDTAIIITSIQRCRAVAIRVTG